MPDSLLSPLWQMPPVAPPGMLGEMDPMELMRRAALMRGPLTMASSNDEMDRIDAGWLRDLRNQPTPAPSPGPAAPQQAAQPEEEKPLWRRAIDFFGQGAQNLTESYNDALSDNMRGAVLPIRRDPQTGDYSLAWPRMLDVINTLPSPATAGGITLGAGGAVARKAADAGLDLSTEARLARAAEQGFHTKNPLYHATTEDFAAFNTGMAGAGGNAGNTMERATFLTSKPEVADGYLPHTWLDREAPEVKEALGDLGPGDRAYKYYGEGANVMPTFVRGLDRFDVWDMFGGGYTPEFMQKQLKAAKRAKKAGVVFRNMADPGVMSLGRPKPSHIVAVFDPANIRSVHAKFDPAQAGSADLLASRAAPGIAMGQPPRMTEDEYWAMLAAGRT